MSSLQPDADLANTARKPSSLSTKLNTQQQQLRPPHTRHLSSYSSTTLHSGRDSLQATEVSHAYTVDSSSAQVELLPRDESQGPMGRQPSDQGTRVHSLRDPHHRTNGGMKRRWWIKLALELVIGSWAAYNTVRYFLSSSIYHSHSRRIISIVLGTSTLLSLSLLAISLVLAWRLARQTSYTLRTSFLYTTSILLFAPAVVNFVLVFVWRHATDPYVALGGRCHWDVDVVWTGTGAQCEPPRAKPWGAWLAASIVRLVATALVLGTYHTTTHHATRPRLHIRKASDFPESIQVATTLPTFSDPWPQSASTTPMATVSSALTPRRIPRTQVPLLAETTPPVSPEPETRLYRSSLTSSLAPVEEDNLPSAPLRDATPSLSDTALPPSSTSDSVSEGEDERLRRRMADMELIQFAAQFRSIVHQMQLDTAAGMDLGTPSEGEDFTPRSDDSGEDYGFPAAGNILPDPGRLVLGRYVRRMSTIESLGSHEGDSPIAASASTYHPPSTAYSAYTPTSTRPPTRLTMRTASESTSAAPSRSNSLTLGRAIGDTRPTTSSPLISEPGGGRASPAPRTPGGGAAEPAAGHANSPELRQGRASPRSGPPTFTEPPEPHLVQRGGRASPGPPPSPADSGVSVGWATGPRIVSSPASAGRTPRSRSLESTHIPPLETAAAEQARTAVAASGDEQAH